MIIVDTHWSICNRPAMIIFASVCWIMRKTYFCDETTFCSRIVFYIIICKVPQQLEKVYCDDIHDLVMIFIESC